MRRKLLAPLVLMLTLHLAAAGPAAASRPWRIVLPDTVSIQGDTALLRDVAQEPVPAAAGELVLRAQVSPNTVVRISRQMILRKLVTAGLSAGVSFRGSDSCCLAFAGREVSSDVLATEIRRQLRELVPVATPGAPASWFEMEYPSRRLSAVGEWRVSLNRRVPLAPGRNLVQVRMEAGTHHEVFGVSVVLHSFGETARVIRSIERDMPLDAAQFTWQWQDLSTLDSGVSVGREQLAGASATHTMSAGDMLRQPDLHETPLILAGDLVELLVVRGQVSVTVRALARQQGCLHQTIPVRNELTGRLVNARVAGPGLVEWRR